MVTNYRHSDSLVDILLLARGHSLNLTNGLALVQTLICLKIGSVQQLTSVMTVITWMTISTNFTSYKMFTCLKTVEYNDVTKLKVGQSLHTHRCTELTHTFCSPPVADSNLTPRGPTSLQGSLRWSCGPGETRSAKRSSPYQRGKGVSNSSLSTSGCNSHSVRTGHPSVRAMEGLTGHPSERPVEGLTTSIIVVINQAVVMNQIQMVWI